MEGKEPTVIVQAGEQPPPVPATAPEIPIDPPMEALPDAFPAFDLGLTAGSASEASIHAKTETDDAEEKVETESDHYMEMYVEG